MEKKQSQSLFAYPVALYPTDPIKMAQVGPSAVQHRCAAFSKIPFPGPNPYSVESRELEIPCLPQGMVPILANSESLQDLEDQSTQVGLQRPVGFSKRPFFKLKTAPAMYPTRSVFILFPSKTSEDSSLPQAIPEH